MSDSSTMTTEKRYADEEIEQEWHRFAVRVQLFVGTPRYLDTIAPMAAIFRQLQAERNNALAAVQSVRSEREITARERDEARGKAVYYRDCYLDHWTAGEDEESETYIKIHNDNKLPWERSEG